MQARASSSTVERRHPPGHGLLPIGDGHHLLSLQGQEEQAAPFELGPAGELGAPPVQPLLHLVEKGGLELIGPAPTVQLAGAEGPKKWAAP